MPVKDDPENSSPQIEDAVRHELIQTAFQHSLFSIGGQAVAAVALWTVLWQPAPPTALWSWSALWGLSVGLQARGRWRYFATMPAGDNAGWESVFRRDCVLSALMWGAAVVLLFPDDPTLRLYFVAILFGLVSASPASLASQRQAMTLFIAIFLTPFAARFFFAGEPSITRAVLGVAVIAYTLIFLRIGRSVNTTMSEAIRLRFENEMLAENMAQQKLRAENALAIADDANRQKTRFLAAASHDLRQPVHAIGLMVSALATEPLSPAASDMLNRLQLSVRGLDGLFGSLLDISRLDAGRVQAQPIPISVRSFLEPLAARFEAIARARGIAFRVRVCDGVMLSAPALLEALLSNLLSNAIRYTSHGGVLLAVRRRAAALSLEVWDTGQGIPPDKLEEIFGEFVQLHNPERDRNQGLGLGLAVCRRLATLLGHRLSLRSRLGRGTVFALEVASSSVPLDAIDPAPASGVTATSLHGLLVLLVDDEEDVLHATSALLRAWGVSVLEARGSAEALAQVQSSDRFPDVLITDHRLRGETGTDVIAAIKQALPVPVHVFVITGDAALAPILDDQVELFAKPLAPEVLRAALGKIAATSDTTASAA